jgi:hypothetical protein
MNLHHCGNLKPYNTQRMSTILSMEGNKGENAIFTKCSSQTWVVCYLIM